MTARPNETVDPIAALRSDGDTAAPAFPVRSTTVRIGQGPQNDVVLDDDTVSSSHATLHFDGAGWKITDLESRNGTYVGGSRLPPRVATPLPDGASVGFGAVKLTFQQIGSPAASSTAHRAPAEQPSAGPPPSSGFRLPVWLLLLIIILVAAVAFLMFGISGAESIPQPAPEAPTASVESAYRVAA